MKANEAPEKIYLQDSMSTDTIGDLWPEWFDDKVSDYSIEYTRTDAFIEKACNYLFSHMGLFVTFFDDDIVENIERSEFIKKFRKEMEDKS